MAKLSLIVKAERGSKFPVRNYTRCKACGRPRAYIGKFQLCRICFRVYGNVWRYASFDEYLFASLADVCGGIVGALLCWFLHSHLPLWYSVAIVASFSVGAHVARFCYQHLYRISTKDKNVSKIGVAIVANNNELADGYQAEDAASLKNKNNGTLA